VRVLVAFVLAALVLPGRALAAFNVNLQDPSKIYAVVVESGNSVACGVGGRGGISAIYLRTCRGTEWQYALGHEIFHSLGAVNACATHHSGDGHVTDDPNDLMDPYARTSGSPSLDLGHDDYWGPAGDDHLPAACPASANVVNSRFLSSHPYFRVSVAVNGSGQVYGLSAVPCARGTVVDECDTVIGDQTAIDLTAKAFPGFHFAGWSGAGCTGAGECSFTVGGDTVLTATFAPDPLTRLQIKGKGRLTGDFFGSCAKAFCGVRFPYGKNAVLRAVPAKHGRFLRWNGACHGTAPTCTIKPTAALTVVAVFAP
jgi:Divergent InlB B-repeat domain